MLRRRTEIGLISKLILSEGRIIKLDCRCKHIYNYNCFAFSFLFESQVCIERTFFSSPPRLRAKKLLQSSWFWSNILPCALSDSRGTLISGHCAAGAHFLLSNNSLVDLILFFSKLHIGSHVASGWITWLNLDVSTAIFYSICRWLPHERRALYENCALNGL
jgi:hypothetical protein